MRGALRLGLFHSFSSSLLPLTLAEFTLRYPAVRVTARLVPHVEMERDLLNGELDLAVAYISEDKEHILFEPLFNEALVLVVGSKHPFASKRDLPMRELATLPLALLTQEFAARQFIDKFFADAGLQAKSYSR